MTRIEWDTSEVDRLAVDLSRAPGRIQRSAPKVFEVAANKIKKGMKVDASGHNYLPSLDAHVSYDKLSPLDFIIGFEKRGQGNLANFAAFGSVNNAPVLNLTGPLSREVPFMREHLAEAGEDAVLGTDAQ